MWCYLRWFDRPGTVAAGTGRQGASKDAIHAVDPCRSLTGFIGERTNRAVAIMTDDFRRYHDLAPFFEERGVRLLGLAPGEEIPPVVRVVVGGPEGDARTVPMAVDPVVVWLGVLAALDPRRDHEPYRRVVVGIDPGETIGLAVLADGSVFWYEECHDVAAVAPRVSAWHGALPARSWRVHVGDGAPDVGQAIMATLRSLPDVHVTFVPEKASSPSTPSTTSRHTDAAIHIAMREAT